jgi:NADPH:quinone reductase-like Zn-dependent oxidoreductase
MRRIVIHKPGGYDRLKIEQAPDPAPGPGEVRIAVQHIGINYADCVVRMGLYESAKKLVGWPITPGFEVAGVIDAVGEDAGDYKIGAPVLALTLFNGYATHVVVPQAQAFPIPDGLDSAQAAALPTVFLTAWFALHELAHVRRGEKVLIHSAAGGVGTAAVQLAALAECQITAVVGAAHKRKLPHELGAQEIIDKSSEDLWAAAERYAPGGYDVILDPNGVSTLGQSYQHLAALGRLVVYGFHSMLPRSADGSAGKPNLAKLAYDFLRTPRFSPIALTTQNRSVLAFNLSFLSTRQDLLIPAMEQILEGFNEKRLRAPPVKRYPFADVAQAHRDLESGQTQGKLVLEV